MHQSRIEHNGMGAKKESGTGAKRVVIVKKGTKPETTGKAKEMNYQNKDRNSDRRNQRQFEGSDDGMSYNPFAALLKK